MCEFENLPILWRDIFLPQIPGRDTQVSVPPAPRVLPRLTDSSPRQGKGTDFECRAPSSLSDYGEGGGSPRAGLGLAQLALLFRPPLRRSLSKGL